MTENETRPSYDLDVVALTITSCILSIVGGITIIATFLIVPETRNFVRKVLLSLTVADLLTASGYLVAATHYYVSDFQTDIYVCLIQSTITTYSCLVSFFFTTVIAVYLFDTVIHRRGRLGTGYWLLFFNVFCWSMPAVIVGVGWSEKVFGEDETHTGATGPWCWIKIEKNSYDYTSQYNPKFWMAMTGKGWEIASYVITTCLYILLIYHLKTRHKKVKFHEIHMCLRDEDRNFLYMWIVFYLSRLWGIIRFLNYVTERPTVLESSMKIFLRMQAVGDPSQAFCNFICFCICDRTIQRKLCSLVFIHIWARNRTEKADDHLAQERFLNPEYPHDKLRAFAVRLKSATL